MHIASDIVDQKSYKIVPFSNELEEKFYKIYRDLQKHYGCTYLSFSYEFTEINEKYFFCTNPDWDRVYIENKLIENCPLVNEGRKLLTHNHNRDVIVPWTFMAPKNKKEKSVDDSRKDFQIFHGLSLSIEDNDIRKYLGIATEEKNKNFIRYLLNDSNEFKLAVAKLRYFANAMVKEITFSKKHVKLLETDEESFLR